MRFFSIYGKESRELKRQVENNFKEFWRPVLQLIKLGYLTYTEAMQITEDELYILWHAVKKVEED